MRFSRQEYWSGLPCPPPGDLPGPGIEPGSPAVQADAVPSEPPGKPRDVPRGRLYPRPVADSCASPAPLSQDSTEAAAIAEHVVKHTLPLVGHRKAADAKRYTRRPLVVIYYSVDFSFDYRAGEPWAGGCGLGRPRGSSSSSWGSRHRLPSPLDQGGGWESRRPSSSRGDDRAGPAPGALSPSPRSPLSHSVLAQQGPGGGQGLPRVHLRRGR